MYDSPTIQQMLYGRRVVGLGLSPTCSPLLHVCLSLSAWFPANLSNKGLKKYTETIHLTILQHVESVHVLMFMQIIQSRAVLKPHKASMTC